MSQRAARALQCSQLAFGCYVRGSTHFGASTRCKAQSVACPCYFLHCQAWLECDAARSKTPPQGLCLGPGRPPAYMPCRICKAEGCSGMLQAAQLAPSLLAAERICCRLCALPCVPLFPGHLRLLSAPFQLLNLDFRHPVTSGMHQHCHQVIEPV